MGDTDGKQSFWTTLPGILTGTAAVLTAATGMFLALHHPTISPIPSGIPATLPETQRTNTAPDPQVGSTAASAQPVTNGVVAITSRDGHTTQVSLKSFRHNMTEDAIELKDGQTIAFEKIAAIDFLAVNDDAHLVAVKVHLADGRAINGDLATNYAFKGESDLGSFVIFVQDAKQIDFNRKT